LGDVAQLGEHLLCKQGVVGSNPIISIPEGLGTSRRCHREKKRVSVLSVIDPKRDVIGGVVGRPG
jgi:hypothetical protein